MKVWSGSLPVDCLEGHLAYDISHSAARCRREVGNETHISRRFICNGVAWLIRKQIFVPWPEQASMLGGKKN